MDTREKETVDARGLSCPQPALMTRQALLRAEEGMVLVLVSSETARDGVTRQGKLNGWQVSAELLADGDYRVVMQK